MDNTQKFHRKSIRLKDYDYTRPGAYFITLVTWQREHVFGEIGHGEMRLNEAGRLVQDAWIRMPAFYPIRHEIWVVMPNHFHGLLWIEGTGEASAMRILGASRSLKTDASPLQRPIGTKPNSLGAIIQNFKSITTRRIHQLSGSSGTPIWQRNYFERVVRDDKEMGRIRAYIQANPVNWLNDQEINQGGLHYEP